MSHLNHFICYNFVTKFFFRNLKREKNRVPPQINSVLNKCKNRFIYCGDNGINSIKIDFIRSSIYLLF